MVKPLRVMCVVWPKCDVMKYILTVFDTYPVQLYLSLTHSTLIHFRLKILQNIGTVFVRMGQYSDAMTSYEHIMSEKPSTV